MIAWIERFAGRGIAARLLRGGTVLVLGIVFMAPTFGLAPPLVFRNDGASEPRGYYVYAHQPPAQLGEIVVMRDPPHFDLPWLMKTVEGVGGARFCWDPRRGIHRLDGRPMPPPHPLAIRLGIPVWRGCRVLEIGEVVGYGRSADSYDSRYFGPVREDRLWGVYRSLWTGS